MKTWILYYRKRLDGDKKTFGVDIWEGDRRNLSTEAIEHKEGYGHITTIDGGITIRGLAELVCNTEKISIGLDDRITSKQPDLIPTNNYVEGHVSDEQIEEFFRTYKELGGAIH